MAECIDSGCTSPDCIAVCPRSVVVAHNPAIADHNLVAVVVLHNYHNLRPLGMALGQSSADRMGFDRI